MHQTGRFPSRVFRRLSRQLGRLHVRLLIVNGIVLLVPVAGLEFARLFERELLASLERDMRNQATLVRSFLEARGLDPFSLEVEQALAASARSTRTRIRVLDQSAQVRLDSHRTGPPEGEESPPPRVLGSSLLLRGDSGPRWSALAERVEVRRALAGVPSAYTRIREREPSVFLFLSEPIRNASAVIGVVYVTRSTRPVMVELYRIRSGLQQVLTVALVFTVGVTLWLAYTITRPLERLSRVATRIAKGQTDVPIPITGTGEVRELGVAFRTMTERLRQRMHDTESFAADVAHAFKSPLTSIRGAAELLEQGAAEDPEVRARFLRNIELDSERLDRLVTRLLQLSRIEASSGPSERVALHSVLVAVAERSATPDVEIVLAEPVPDAFVWGRREDLETAFANLCDNAVKFSPEGGRVTLRLSRNGSVYRVTVEDTGPGVPVELEPRLFQRFFTTDVDHGTGLGLAIVRSVIEAHGGRVFLDRDAAPGARFVVELPARTAQPEPRSAPENLAATR